ncbi:SUN domain-containing protein 3 isoform X2 [Sceloporus undulatus]|uniref:SUN domain-containing protein 3 isoform X2 n=1 Tax=Sceloporus undulatus TaxID=8520 RepID=UPI001C4CD0BD|nr:SUN domain-containing protein 3 isoform X2 [Sceloporus undulatus]
MHKITYRVPKMSGNIYSKEDAKEANNGCHSDCLDSDTQQLLESSSEQKKSPPSCTNNHPLFSRKRRNEQVPCQSKKSIVRLIYNLIMLSAKAASCRVYSILRGNWDQKIGAWVTLFLLLFGISCLGLFGVNKLQLFREKWNDFSICDLIQPNYYPGNCWPFPGNRGEIVVRLAKEIIPRAVTIEHISKKVSPTGEITSAPKDFVIYGLKEEKEERGTFLGQFVYDIEGDIIQTFQLKNEFPKFMGYVNLNVLNNWGHPNYTCIYRFRVHGDIEHT